MGTSTKNLMSSEKNLLISFFIKIKTVPTTIEKTQNLKWGSS